MSAVATLRIVVVARSSVQDALRGQDVLHCVMACLALDWPTRLLLLDAATDWLSPVFSTGESTGKAEPGEEPLQENAHPARRSFRAALPSLAIYGLESIGWHHDRSQWNADPAMAVDAEVLRFPPGHVMRLNADQVGHWLRWADEVLHP